MGASLIQLADGVGKLLTHHLELARLELSTDAKVLGAILARIAVFLPFVVVGYALVCGALTAFVARFIPQDASLLIVGVANLIGGGVGLSLAARRLKGRPGRLQRETSEPDRSAGGGSTGVPLVRGTGER